MDEEQRIRALINRYLENTATPTELAELEKLLANPTHESLLKEILQESYATLKEQGMDGLVGLDAKERIFNYIVQHGQGHAAPKRSRLRWMAVAASIVVLLGIGTYFYVSNYTGSTGVISYAPTDIEPGGNKAYLTLANGQKISLTDAADGTIAQQAGILITKTADGQIVYEILSPSGEPVPNSLREGSVGLGDGQGEEKEIFYNTIETPNGGQYQVRLPDGTAVWLNAGSWLRYPTSFASKKERRVQLSGEGYFEVAKDNTRPFIVASGDQEVEVLGTHFNINAYQDNHLTKTTLLEGSVKVVDQQSARNLLLKPGQQSTNSRGTFSMQDVDADLAVEWKNGYFRFDGKDVEMAMKEIARWYNVEVAFKNQALRNEPIAGRISKYATIGQVTKKLELTGNIRFTLEGRTLVVE